MHASRRLLLLGTFPVVVFAIVMISITLSGNSVSTVSADGSVDWTGQGTTNGELDTVQCSGDTASPGSILWVFTATGAESATITINGQTFDMQQRGDGTFHYVSGWYDLDTVTASASYVGETNNPQLVISHGCPPEETPTETPTERPTETPTEKPTKTATPTEVPPTETPKPTKTPKPTETKVVIAASPTPTSTSVPQVAVPTKTATPVPTETTTITKLPSTGSGGLLDSESGRSIPTVPVILAGIAVIAGIAAAGRNYLRR